LPPPHRPLSVRRPGAPTPRPRPKPEPVSHQELPLEPDEPVAAIPGDPGAGGVPTASVTRGASAVTAVWSGPPAGALRRLASAAVDLCVMVLVDLVTLYFTLRLAGLEPAEWPILPTLPIVVFFLLLNGGYVVILTGTLGQTLGKMALQIGVVVDGRPTVGLARATLRTVAALVSLLPAGLGLVWGFVGDRRTLHDRLCGTRVIRFTVA
jgi:uncharacterized RDD family membrane protein YckC